MALTLLQNTTAIALNRTAPFQAVDGTEPYVYSVAVDGAGGTINASTGLYTSPSVYGDENHQVDTIVVTDADNNTAESQIAICNPVQLVCDIIRSEMDLDDDQVFLWDQKFKTPNDYRIYIAVSQLSVKPFANNRRNDGDGSGLENVQSANFVSMLDIDIMSRSIDALNRKEEVLMALMSNYAERQQEANTFRIFPISRSFVNISQIDGSAIPYRFNIGFAIQYFVSKTKAIEYYDNFEDPSVLTDP